MSRIDLPETSSFFDRISQIIHHRRFKHVNEFAMTGLGYKSAEKIHRLKKGTNKPSYNIILDILNRFPEVNPEWLITGQGRMLKKDLQSVTPEVYPKETIEEIIAKKVEEKISIKLEDLKLFIKEVLSREKDDS